MSGGHTRKASELDPRKVEIHFSPEVQRAFGDLAAAVHSSEHFDPDMLKTVQEWAGGKPATVQDVMIALPALAQESLKHAQATGDNRAEAAWGAIGSELLEKGFTLSKGRVRGA
jgi:hypothetical protein